jgi:hypothetical protein
MSHPAGQIPRCFAMKANFMFDSFAGKECCGSASKPFRPTPDRRSLRIRGTAQ